MTTNLLLCSILQLKSLHVFAVIAVGTVLAALIDVVTISAEAAEGVVTIGSVAAAVGVVTILSVAAGGDFVAVE